MTGTKEKGRQPRQGLTTRVFNETTENRIDLPMNSPIDQHRGKRVDTAHIGQ
jgi:hypothetical protein